MQHVPIQRLPNQNFSILLDGNSWDFVMKTVEDVTVVSLTLNGSLVVDNAHAPAGALIIPAAYQEAGNFFFVTQSEQLPFYTAFNVTQSLIYISAAELASLRTPKPPPVTSGNFNPIAALPLRFAPQGYVEA